MGFLPELVIIDSILIFLGGLYGFLKQGSKASIIASTICSLVLIGSVLLLSASIIKAKVFDIVILVLAAIFMVMFGNKAKKASSKKDSDDEDDTPLLSKDYLTNFDINDTKKMSVYIFYGLTLYNALLTLGAGIVLVEIS